MESHRKTGKRLMSMIEALEILRANGAVRAERTDPATGEVRPLSAAAVSRALRAYALHPDQLTRPAPSVELKSLHPNHVWQIDASLCVLYYLRARTASEAGLQVMERERFYKNKPANLKRIESERVWSYECTDHYSGSIKVRYVLGAESGQNLADSFIDFIQQQPHEPCHGVPFILMMDMGSTNTSGLFKNLARRLGVQLLPHAVGNARATGQVEKARDIIERSFESGLRFAPVADLDALNASAQRWSAWFNTSRIHSRTGRTRGDVWLGIAHEQLRRAPPVQVCRQLMTHTPEARKVQTGLTVKFDGREYDVSQVPGVMVGESLQVTYGVYQQDACTIVTLDADGHERLIDAPLVVREGAGNFRADANVIGEQWARPADTLADAHRKEVRRHAYGAATDERAEAARKAHAVPFDGRIDPARRIGQAPKRLFIPRQGVELTPAATHSAQPQPERVLTLFEASCCLAQGDRLGAPLTPAQLALLRQRHPQGVPESALDAITGSLRAASGLRVIAGGR